jgi:hypothetical protein
MTCRLGDQRIEAATPAAVAQAASKVKGKTTTFLALRKSSM